MPTREQNDRRRGRFRRHHQDALGDAGAGGDVHDAGIDLTERWGGEEQEWEEEKEADDGGHCISPVLSGEWNIERWPILRRLVNATHRQTDKRVSVLGSTERRGNRGQGGNKDRPRFIVYLGIRLLCSQK